LRPLHARKSVADEELWGLTALCTILIIERCPNAITPPTATSCRGAKILRERGYPLGAGPCGNVRHADLQHAAPRLLSKHTLFACDELADSSPRLLCAPVKSILDLEMESVKKKLKDKASPGGVSPTTFATRRHLGISDREPSRSAQRMAKTPSPRLPATLTPPAAGS